MGRKQATVDADQDVASALYVALGRINRALRRDADAPVVAHGALSALTALSHSGPMRLGELATKENVTAASITRIAASLEQVGYLSRSRDPDDGRAFLVQATDLGHRVVSEGRAAYVHNLRTRLDRLPPAELARIVAAVPALATLAEDPVPAEN